MVNSIECFLKVDKNSTNKIIVIKIFIDQINAWLVQWSFLKPNCFLFIFCQKRLKARTNINKKIIEYLCDAISICNNISIYH